MLDSVNEALLAEAKRVYRSYMEERNKYIYRYHPDYGFSLGFPDEAIEVLKGLFLGWINWVNVNINSKNLKLKQGITGEPIAIFQWEESIEIRCKRLLTDDTPKMESARRLLGQAQGDKQS